MSPYIQTNMDPMTPGADVPMEEKKEEGQEGMPMEAAPEAAPETPAAE